MEDVKETIDPRPLGDRIADLDRRELCDLIARLCDLIRSEVGSGGYRGGVYPDNVFRDEDSVRLGPASKSDWSGQERDFLAPELFWHGQKSPAADVYSLGLLLYYAVNSARLPFYKSGADGARQRRMSGETIVPPKAAGRRLSEIIAKATAFQAGDRYRSLAELKAALQSCVDNIYLSGPVSAETLYHKSEEELSNVEKMMLDILRKEENPEIVKTENEEEQVPQEPIVGPLMEETQPADPVPEPAQEEASASEETNNEPVIILEEDKNPELEPVVIGRSSPPQYQNSTERERKIATKVRHRRLRPVILILLVCVILLAAAYIREYITNRDLNKQLNEVVNAEDVLGKDLPPLETPPPTVVEATPEPSYLPLETPKPPEQKVTSYELVVGDYSWADAKDNAAHRGGHLVVINSDAEFQKVLELAQQSGVTYIWLGARRVDGAMTWLDGSVLGRDDPHWNDGEPSGIDTYSGVAEDYLMLSLHNGSWRYNDISGDPAHDYKDYYSGKVAYIIEIES